MVELERIHPETRPEWRAWLETHHDTSPGVWVVLWRAATGKGRVTYDDLVEEAVCFGWIDGRANTLDDERSMLMMTRRKPTSAWARSNKERVQRLTAEGRMTDAGLRAIEAAKANGSWTFLDDVDALVMPDDLLAALARDEQAQRYFDAFPPSAKKMILYWIKSAKRPDTRRRRIADTVRLAAQNIRAPQPSRP
ncbi:MAG TPA: YdeI/OmpD-associated family protein [Acidimicrobiales bacterium]